MTASAPAIIPGIEENGMTNLMSVLGITHDGKLSGMTADGKLSKDMFAQLGQIDFGQLMESIMDLFKGQDIISMFSQGKLLAANQNGTILDPANGKPIPETPAWALPTYPAAGLGMGATPGAPSPSGMG